MYILQLNNTFSPKKVAEAITILKSMVGPTSVMPGCREIRIYREVDNAETIMLLSEWENREALEQHIQSADFRKILAFMELGNNVPEISFNNVSIKQGFELVEKLRC